MLRNQVETQEPTPYEVLGVGRNATQREIRNAYHALARVHHPDKGGDADNFSKICRAYEYLSGGSRTVETLHIPIEAFDAFNTAFNTAIDNCDLTTLDQLYARFPITFSEDYVVKALTHISNALKYNREPNFYDFDFFIFRRRSQQPNYTIGDRVNTLLWLLNHDAEGNVSIRATVTLTQRDRIDTVQNGVVISTRYQDYSKKYDWETTLLGFAMFHKQTALLNGLIQIQGIRLEDILIPSSAKWEEYATGLEYSAQQGWSDVVAAYLNKQRCQIPKIQELGNAIYNAGQKSHYAIKNLLTEYRSKHYRYNPFKFGYNPEWHEDVDISWAATFNAVPGNFKIAVNDFIYTCKYVYNAVFCRQALYNAVFGIAGVALTGFFMYAGFSAASAIASQTLAEMAVVGITFTYIASTVLLAKVYKDLNQRYLDFVHSTFDPVMNRANEFVYGCWQKVKNSVSATRAQPESNVPAQHDQVQNASASTATRPDTTQSWLNYRLPNLFFAFSNAPAQQQDGVRAPEVGDQPNARIERSNSYTI